MTLEEFIAECVATRDARRARRDAEEAQRQAEIDALRQSVLQNVRQRVNDAIPAPLRQFRSYAGETPTLKMLQDYPLRWQPCDFKIEAPGLALITFNTNADTPTSPMRVVDIHVGAKVFGGDWIEAVAEAFDAA